MCPPDRHMVLAAAALWTFVWVLLQCKTEVCQELLQQHVSWKGFKGAVWLMGHTSSDPTVDLPPGTKRKSKVRCKE